MQAVGFFKRRLGPWYDPSVSWTLIPMVGGVLTALGFTSFWVLTHNTEIQYAHEKGVTGAAPNAVLQHNRIKGTEAEPYLKETRPHFVGRTRAKKWRRQLEHHVDSEYPPGGPALPPFSRS